MKKNILFLVVITIIFTLVITLISFLTDTSKNGDEKIEVVATLFPQYDFVKQVGGDKVNVTLLLPSGTESHTYEPTPKDMVNINNSQLFIYTGKEMEPWAEQIIAGMKKDVNVLDLSKTVDLINSEEFENEHEHEHEDENEEEEHHEHEEHEHDHNHSYDPHIWLNPKHAIKMVESIRDELCKIDPDNKEYYTANAEAYIQEIQGLDNDFEQVVANSKTKKIAFGGAFAYAYFIERYNLEFISAYESCGENVEPSTMKIKEVIDYINTNNLPVIFYKEYTNGNVAKTISESTGAKMLVFNTVHNVSKAEIENNATYVSIMKQNLENLKIALEVE